MPEHYHESITSQKASIEFYIHVCLLKCAVNSVLEQLEKLKGSLSNLENKHMEAQRTSLLEDLYGQLHKFGIQGSNIETFLQASGMNVELWSRVTDWNKVKDEAKSANLDFKKYIRTILFEDNQKMLGSTAVKQVTEIVERFALKTEQANRKSEHVKARNDLRSAELKLKENFRCWQSDDKILRQNHPLLKPDRWS